MMPYIIILKGRKFHQPTANCFGTARQKPTANCFGTARQKPVGGGGAHCILNRVKAVQSLENICASVYSSSHIGRQKNVHQPIFPHNITGNFPTSWATNSAFSGPNDFGMETYHMILQSQQNLGETDHNLHNHISDDII